MAPIRSLDRCMDVLRFKRVETDRARLGPLGLDAVPGRCLGILWHELHQFSLAKLVVTMRRPGAEVACGKLSPQIGGRHINDPEGFQPRPRHLDPEQGRRIATLPASPEL